MSKHKNSYMIVGIKQSKLKFQFIAIEVKTTLKARKSHLKSKLFAIWEKQRYTKRSVLWWTDGGVKHGRIVVVFCLVASSISTVSFVSCTVQEKLYNKRNSAALLNAELFHWKFPVFALVSLASAWVALAWYTMQRVRQEAASRVRVVNERDNTGRLEPPVWYLWAAVGA